MSIPVLSVVIPLWDRDHNLERLLPAVRRALADLSIRTEVVVAVPRRRVRALPDLPNVEVAVSERSGYGDILKAGMDAASGDFVVTMDADFSHRPDYLRTMWHHRNHGEVLLGSRYVRGAVPEMTLTRRWLSRVLNYTYRKTLSLPYRDLSSGFRLYHRRVLDDIGPPRGEGLDVLPEMVVRAYCQGWRITEVPFWYRGARPWTRARMVRLGARFLRSLGRLFALRNSVKAADYDHRAFDSWIPLQRYWQRRRFSIIQSFAPEGLILDIGCGSSRIVQALPHVVGVDLALRKLRWLRAPGRHLMQADMKRLPFRDGAFDAVICSEVIEHIPRDQVHLEELVRVIRPGGQLVLGTPDYGRRTWRALEWIYGRVFPGGYVKEHINRYTHGGLRFELEELGLQILDFAYVGHSEMIFRTQVPPSAIRHPLPAPSP
jgi:SAM-dependent methyltransferase